MMKQNDRSARAYLLHTALIAKSLLSPKRQILLLIIYYFFSMAVFSYPILAARGIPFSKLNEAEFLYGTYDLIYPNGTAELTERLEAAYPDWDIGLRELDNELYQSVWEETGALVSFYSVTPNYLKLAGIKTDPQNLVSTGFLMSLPTISQLNTVHLEEAIEQLRTVIPALKVTGVFPSNNQNIIYPREAGMLLKKGVLTAFSSPEILIDTGYLNQDLAASELLFQFGLDTPSFNEPFLAHAQINTGGRSTSPYYAAFLFFGVLFYIVSIFILDTVIRIYISRMEKTLLQLNRIGLSAAALKRNCQAVLILALTLGWFLAAAFSAVLFYETETAQSLVRLWLPSGVPFLIVTILRTCQEIRRTLVPSLRRSKGSRKPGLFMTAKGQIRSETARIWRWAGHNLQSDRGMLWSSRILILLTSLILMTVVYGISFIGSVNTANFDPSYPYKIIFNYRSYENNEEEVRFYQAVTDELMDGPYADALYPVYRQDVQLIISIGELSRT